MNTKAPQTESALTNTSSLFDTRYVGVAAKVYIDADSEIIIMAPTIDGLEMALKKFKIIGVDTNKCPRMRLIPAK